MRNFIFSLLITFLIANQPAQASDQIRIVGSSTVYPFVSTVSERLGKNTDFKPPIVESTGTGGGFKLFCSGTGDNDPHIVDASRRITPEELLICYKNDILDIIEIKIGFDGIVIANAKEALEFDLSSNEIFLALARHVPSKRDPKKLVPNFYNSWNEINPKLPNQKIEVYGPPPTSGTRDNFVELIMEGGCWHLDAYKTAYSSFSELKIACHSIREDGKFIESGENDNLIIKKLAVNKDALGIFGYSYLKENGNIVKAAALSGIKPTYETIFDGTYIMSRPLFVYVKRASVESVGGIKEFIAELVSDKTIGKNGYLVERGLISLSPEDLHKVQNDALTGKKLENLAEEDEAALEDIKQSFEKISPAAGSIDQ